MELEGSLCAEPRRRFQDWELTLRLPDGRRVLVLTQPGDRLVPGDRLRCLARALSPPRPAGPDEFDLSAWLARRQISQRLRTTEVQVVRPGSGPLAWIAHAKQAGRALLREQVSRRNQPFFRAILLGEPLGPGSSLRQAFRDSGTAHLLSISGLHVGFVALLGLLIGRVLALSRSERSALAILFVVAYALATGLRVPIVRAGVGGVVFLIAPSRGDSWNRLACALLVVLAWDPASLYDVGLVLSFGTVAGLIALAPPLARLADPGADPLGTGPRQSPGGQVYRFLLATLLTAVAAFLASAPLLAATIGEVPLPALWLGPPAIALFGLVLGLALIGVVLGVVLSPVATPFLALADLLTDLLRSLVVQGTAGLSPFEVPQLSPLVYLALAGLLGLTALRLERSRSPASA